MNTTKISHVAHLVEICVAHGVEQVVISPGSRNAPLVIALDSHPKIETFLIHDERCAAFFAMGLAEKSDKPVAITCTSGSAPLNYAPALAEAYYRNIPLLVLTADRPVTMVDQGDGQTIRQKNVFNNYIKAQFETPDFPKLSEDLKRSDQLVNEALNHLTTIPRGPVHINIPLTEPLYEVQELKTSPEIKFDQLKDQELSTEEELLIKETWGKAEKKLVLIGQLQPGELAIEHLKPILNDPSVAILVENTSNITDFQRICHCIDRTLMAINEDEVEDFKPDLLITFGGAVISKKIKAFFRKHKPQFNWRVGRFAFIEDTYQGLTHAFDVNPVTFLNYIGELDLSPTSNFGSKWKQRDFIAQDKHHEFLAKTNFSDLKAFECILDTLPDGSNLHMGNSSVVRYCQLFNPVRTIDYYSNRGVSGIDGSTSTAAGIAYNSPNKLNVVISGDISFFYDSNALWNQHLRNNLRIVVINNNGGGIFKFIDGPRQSEQTGFFVAPFEADIKSLCQAFGIEHMYADSEESLMTQFSSFYQINDNKRPVLLEVDTRDLSSDEILRTYFRELGN